MEFRAELEADNPSGSSHISVHLPTPGDRKHCALYDPPGTGDICTKCDCRHSTVTWLIRVSLNEANGPMGIFVRYC